MRNRFAFSVRKQKNCCAFCCSRNQVLVTVQSCRGVFSEEVSTRILTILSIHSSRNNDASKISIFYGFSVVMHANDPYGKKGCMYGRFAFRNGNGSVILCMPFSISCILSRDGYVLSSAIHTSTYVCTQ